MPKNDLLDDIDYSSLHPAESTPAPIKSNIQDRQFKKEKPKAQAKDIDIEALKTQAAQTKELAGTAELPPSNLDYVIPGLGILGGLYLLHQNLRSRDLPAIPKQDMRTAPSAAPIAPVSSAQPPLPAGLSPQDFQALSPEDKALVLRGGQNTIAKQTAQQELAQQVNKLQTELASIPQSANPVPVSNQEAAKIIPSTASSGDPLTDFLKQGLTTNNNQSSSVQTVMAESPKPALNPTSDGSIEIEKPVASATEEPKKSSKKKSESLSFKTAADIPAGYEFRPDVGNLDRSMYNILGPEHRQQAKEWLTGGKMFGHSADVNTDVSKLSTEYFQRLQSEIPETILSRDARRAQNIPSKFGNYGATGFGKAAKVAGVAGTLFAVADLANAQTPEQKANAGVNLLGAVLPPGMDVLEAGAPTVGQQSIANAYKLGSPYAQTEEAKKARLREKAGAGRGIAPPSAYMR